MRRLATITAGLALALATPSAHADDPAGDRFNEGLALLKAGDATGACARFRASLEARPTVGAMARVAECEEKDGHPARATATWKRALDLARGGKDSRVGDIEASIRRIDGVLPKLHLVVPADAPPGLHVRLDGTEIAPADVVPLDPGPHLLTVEAAQKRTGEVRFDARADGKVIDLALPPLLDELPTTTPAEPPPPEKGAGATPSPEPIAPVTLQPRPSPWLAPAEQASPPRRKVNRGLRDTGAVIMAAGGLIAAGGLGFAVASLANKANAGCNGFACTTQDAANTLHAAKTDADVATGLTLGGAAAIGLGLLLFETSSSRASALARIEVAPSVDRTSIGLAVGGLF